MPLSFFIVLLLCLALAFVLAWLYFKEALARKNERLEDKEGIISDLQKKIDLKPQVASEGKAECPDKWLHEIAAKHREEIGRYVQILGVTAEVNHNSPTPYAKFSIGYYNASVYTISIDPAPKGSISYGGRRLTQPIELITAFKLDNLQPNFLNYLEFYQWLTKEELDFIVNDENWHNHYFDLSQLIFTVIGAKGEAGITPQPFRYDTRHAVRFSRPWRS
jgi:hypothetical protein